MRLRKSIAAVLLVSSLALPVYAAREERGGTVRVRIVRAVKKVLTIISMDTGDNLTPPKP
jgi:hypothetical protein